MQRYVLLLALLFASVALAACGGETARSTDTIGASVLVEPNAEEAQWFRDVEVEEGTDGYELLLEATGGQVEAEFYGEFQSHFVESVLGIAPEGAEFWGVFLWNEESESWEPLPEAADFHTVEDGDIMGWALVEYDESQVNLPASQP
ncbi:MAG: hypothetical protein WD533_07395 [Dehalococcoidia bacterium]